MLFSKNGWIFEIKQIFARKAGKWMFVVKQIFARRAEKYGDKYTASAVITKNSSGQWDVEMFTNRGEEKLKQKDVFTFRDGIAALSGETKPEMTGARYKNGKTKQVTR